MERFEIKDSVGSSLSFDLKGMGADEWIETSIDCSTASFRGRLDATIELGDFELLLEELKRCSDSFPSSFRFENVERNVEIVGQLDARGRGFILTKLFADDGELSVGCGIDQSVIRRAAEELAWILRRYQKTRTGS